MHKCIKYEKNIKLHNFYIIKIRIIYIVNDNKRSTGQQAQWKRLVQNRSQQKTKGSTNILTKLTNALFSFVKDSFYNLFFKVICIRYSEQANANHIDTCHR